METTIEFYDDWQMMLRVYIRLCQKIAENYQYITNEKHNLVEMCPIKPLKAKEIFLMPLFLAMNIINKFN